MMFQEKHVFYIAHYKITLLFPFQSSFKSSDFSSIPSFIQYVPVWDNLLISLILYENIIYVYCLCIFFKFNV